MANFYFTFGTDSGFPYCCGWVEVQALDEADAVRTFRAKYPDRTPGIVNCAFWYNEERFCAALSSTPLYAVARERCHAILASDALRARRSALGGRLADMRRGLERLQDTNDGSLEWVDDVRALFAEVQSIEDELAAL